MYQDFVLFLAWWRLVVVETCCQDFKNILICWLIHVLLLTVINCYIIITQRIAPIKIETLSFCWHISFGFTFQNRSLKFQLSNVTISISDAVSIDTTYIPINCNLWRISSNHSFLTSRTVNFRILWESFDITSSAATYR